MAKTARIIHPSLVLGSNGLWGRPRASVVQVDTAPNRRTYRVLAANPVESGTLRVTSTSMSYTTKDVNGGQIAVPVRKLTYIYEPVVAVDTDGSQTATVRGRVELGITLPVLDNSIEVFEFALNSLIQAMVTASDAVDQPATRFTAQHLANVPTLE